MKNPTKYLYRPARSLGAALTTLIALPMAAPAVYREVRDEFDAMRAAKKAARDHDDDVCHCGAHEFDNFVDDVIPSPRLGVILSDMYPTSFTRAEQALNARLDEMYPVEPLIREADPELEALLDEEDRIEARKDADKMAFVEHVMKHFMNVVFTCNACNLALWDMATLEPPLEKLCDEHVAELNLMHAGKLPDIYILSDMNL